MILVKKKLSYNLYLYYYDENIGSMVTIILIFNILLESHKV